jgi:hypothetical protein
MREPWKIIYKYKNSNGCICYKIFIFVGDVESSVKEILSEIQNLSLEQTLDKLDLKKLNILIDTYSTNWYYFFFNKHHIIKSKTSIKKNTSFLKKLKNKLSEDWIKKHFEEPEAIIRTSFFEKYADFIKNKNKLRKTIQQKQENNQKGGNEEINDNEDIDEVEDFIFDTNENDKDQSISTLGDIEEFNLESVNIDNNIKDTQKEIKSILNTNSTNHGVEYSLSEDT